ncbi:hypothetical protein [Peijinzhouia sedimentorum]
MNITEIAKYWNRLDRSEKLEIIEEALEDCNTSEGSLFLRLFRKGNTITGYIQAAPDNDLCVEAVSQDTLISLFSEDHDFDTEDAETILNWMDAQK